MRDTETKVLVSHRFIYRTPLGYSFTRKIDMRDYEVSPDSTFEDEEEIEEIVPVPSLTCYCAWYLSANQNLLQESIEKDEGVVSEHLIQFIEQTKELGSLWKLRFIPTKNTDTTKKATSRLAPSCTYPTLTYLMQRNKDIFKVPVQPQ